jgi:hypothetical protein
LFPKKLAIIASFFANEELTEFLTTLWTYNTTDVFSYEIQLAGQAWFTAVASALSDPARNTGNLDDLFLLPSDFPPVAKNCASPPITDDKSALGVEELRQGFFEGNPDALEKIVRLYMGRTYQESKGYYDGVQYECVKTLPRPQYSPEPPQQPPEDPHDNGAGPRPPEKSKEGLSKGEKIGIGVGVGIAALLAIGAAMYFGRRNRQAQAGGPIANTTPAATNGNAPPTTVGNANTDGDDALAITIPEDNLEGNSSAAANDDFAAAVLREYDQRASTYQLGSSSVQVQEAHNDNGMGQASETINSTSPKMVTVSADIIGNTSDVTAKPPSVLDLHNSVRKNIEQDDWVELQKAVEEKLKSHKSSLGKDMKRAAHNAQVASSFLLRPGSQKHLGIAAVFTDKHGATYHLADMKIYALSESDRKEFRNKLGEGIEKKIDLDNSTKTNLRAENGFCR